MLSPRWGGPLLPLLCHEKEKNSSLIPNFTRQMKMFQIKGHLLLFGITTDNVTVLKCPTFRWPFTQFTFFIMAHLSLGYDFCLVWKYKDFVLQTLMNLIKNHILMNRCLSQVMFVEFIQFFLVKMFMPSSIIVVFCVRQKKIFLREKNNESYIWQWY